MKKAFICALLAAAVACGGTASYAQQGKTGQAQHAAMPPEQHLQAMTKMLNLTPDQQKKIKPLLDSEFEQTKAVRQNTSMQSDDQIAKMRDIRMKTDAQIKPILTPQQLQKWEQMRSQHEEEGMQHRTPPVN